MKDDRLRVAVDDAYVEALGRTVYVFATLEWNAVWCCERMRPGYVRTLGRKTAGVIADDLLRYARRRPDIERPAFVTPAEAFKRLVEVRNAILHGKPGTADGGDQRLFSEGTALGVEALHNAADDFSHCSLLLNALLYDQLRAS